MTGTPHQPLLTKDHPQHEPFNYATTFKIMNQRRMERQYQGIYPGPSKPMTILAQLVWLYTVAVVLLTSATDQPHDQVTLQSAILVLIALVAVQYIARRKRSRLLLLMVYCAVVAHVTFFALFGDVGLFEISDSTHLNHAVRLTALLVLAFVEAAILLVYGVVYRLYPLAVQREWINTAKWFDITTGNANSITYRAFSLHWPWPSRSRYTIQYKGMLDEQFRPHGFGTWRDSHYHGEVLSGEWEHGKPIGPFTSLECGSGYASQQIRVAYGLYRTETKPDQMYFIPKFPEDKQVRWGVARIECSVAGGHFKFLPHVEHFFDRANAPRSAAECAATLRTPLRKVYYRDVVNEQIVSDHRLAPTQYSESIVASLLTEDEKNSTPHYHKKEALVFIHGINNSLDDAIKLCGQLISRGDFPSQIYPFVFSWAGGNFPVPSYWLAKQRADSEEVAIALHSFVASIVDAGYTEINFVTHSMGTRVFLNTIERHSSKDLFQNGSTSSPVTMSTVTLCSPEFPLDRFVKAGGTYDVLRKYCKIITIYGDEKDLALRVSEIANRDWNLCGSLVKSLGCNVNSVVRDASFAASPDCICVDMNEFDASPQLASLNEKAGFPHVFSYTQCEPVPEPSTRSYGTASSSDEQDDDAASSAAHVDVDVVNTSFTDTNVGNRHSYFRMNESIVEDIRDLVLHKRRAYGRAGLMRREGNVFIFLSTPKDIV